MNEGSTYRVHYGGSCVCYLDTKTQLDEFIARHDDVDLVTRGYVECDYQDGGTYMEWRDEETIYRRGGFRVEWGFGCFKDFGSDIKQAIFFCDQQAKGRDPKDILLPKVYDGDKVLYDPFEEVAA